MFRDKSAMTVRITDILRGVNHMIEWDTLVNSTGVKSINSIRASVSSARRALERDKISFDVIRGVGLQRLSDSEKVHSTEKHKKRMRNTARNGIKRLSSVDNFVGLDNSDQIVATLNRTLFETVKQHTSLAKKSVKADPLPIPKV